MRIFLTGTIVIIASLAPVPAAFADEAAKRGHAVVEQWCRACHLRLTDRANADMAPPFEAIVLRPGRDRWFFEQFLWDDHFPMPTYRLFDSEKSDVVAYLMQLRNSGQD